MRVASLHIYPVKGCRAVDLVRTDVLGTGLRHDRRFMLLGADGTFLTQRKHPQLALVETAIGRRAGSTPTLSPSESIADASLVLRVPSGAELRVPIAPLAAAPRRRATVWKDEVACVDAGGEAAAFFSDFLGEACTLVFMPDDVVRQVDLAYARPGDRVGFADGFPVLVASLASLADVNARLDAPVPMDRFRPNLVIEGGEAWDEERHGTLVAGDVRFRLVKRCSRCDVTLVDQKTAAKGKEPLRTLASYRTENNNVYFAMNAIPDLGDRAATLRVGDAIRLDD